MRCSGFVASTALLLLLAGCASQRVEVVQFGTMRAALREGRSEARVDLATVADRPHAYAVGAAAGLDGEVTILDGVVWVTRVRDEALVTAADGRATLLTAAHVDAWRTTTLGAPLEGDDLETAIERAANDAGLDVTAPFPFVLEGGPAALDVHVINGACPMADPERAAAAPPWRWSGAPGAPITVVGFFARDSIGVITHHDSAVHMHAIATIDGRAITAHVERLCTGPGMTLRVPAR